MTAFPALPRSIVAILRGLDPGEAEAIGAAIFDAGIQAIEVPLNSPDPFGSIATLVRTLPDAALVGAGTVLTTADVDRLAGCGGRLLVSPNIDPAVMDRAAHHAMVTMPGVFTPTEALLAVRLGASALKFFPASVLGPGGIAAMRAVLPADVPVGVVGGISEADFAAYSAIGVRLFGLGSSLFRPGTSTGDVALRARVAVKAWDAVFGAG